MKTLAILSVSIVLSSCGIQDVGFSYNPEGGFKINIKVPSDPKATIVEESAK